MSHLFSDGVACALVSGDKSSVKVNKAMPKVIATTSKLMPDSEDVMGWDVKNTGLMLFSQKVFQLSSRNWLGPFVHEFLSEHGLTKDDITHFVAHPGGKKILEAYETALGFDQD